jgi:hypothetical protein
MEAPSGTVSRYSLSFSCWSLHADLLLSLLFNREDVGDMFFQNFGLISTDYTALYPRRIMNMESLCECGISRTGSTSAAISAAMFDDRIKWL